MNNSIKKFTNGFIINQRIENPVIYPNSITPNKTCGPYDWIFQASFGLVFIKYPEKICDPSKGDTGIKLKTARAMFI